VRRINLATGLLRRDAQLLLVRGTYAREPAPLWTLPGGRQEATETLAQTVIREFREETSLDVEIRELAYVSESMDREADLHVVNCTFWVSETDKTITPRSNDPKIVETRFLPLASAIELLRADVLRVPVTAALGTQSYPRYFVFDEREVLIPFFARGKRLVRGKPREHADG
jgi:8-oxo-dGTP diphosphatase